MENYLLFCSRAHAKHIASGKQMLTTQVYSSNVLMMKSQSTPCELLMIIGRSASSKKAQWSGIGLEATMNMRGYLGEIPSQ